MAVQEINSFGEIDNALTAPRKLCNNTLAIGIVIGRCSAIEVVEEVNLRRRMHRPVEDWRPKKPVLISLQSLLEHSNAILADETTVDLLRLGAPDGEHREVDHSAIVAHINLLHLEELGSVKVSTSNDRRQDGRRLRATDSSHVRNEVSRQRICRVVESDHICSGKVFLGCDFGFWFCVGNWHRRAPRWRDGQFNGTRAWII